MFERFTDRARRVVVIAQEEARRLEHSYIGTEHILLGLIREGDGLAARALRTMQINLDELKAEVEALVGRGQSAPPGHIPFTPRAKKTLELSLRESVQLSSGYIGTEHILLGVLREGEGPGAQVLAARGVTLEATRDLIARLLAKYGEEHPGQAGVVRTGVPLLDIEAQLRTINQRLSAIEDKLGVETPVTLSHLRRAETALALARRQKDQAIDEQDFERAAKLRDQEKKLIKARDEAEKAWLAESAPPPADTEPPDTATA
jgi:ATP-dependent Clp protease ATP-binding subunit ClpC